MPRLMCLVALVAGLAVEAAAAPHPELGRPRISSWTVGDYRGRSHQNWDVRMDPAGRVWVGNGSGVQSFDGARWQLLSLPASTLVYSHQPAADGRVYAATVSELGYFEPDETASWRWVSLVEGRPDVPPFGNVERVAATTDDVFFVGREILFRYRPASDGLAWYRPLGTFGEIAASGEDLYISDRGGGIFRYDSAADRLVPEPGPPIRETGIVLLAADAEGRLIAGSGESGLWLRDGDVWRPFPTEADDWLRSAGVYRLVVLADGVLALTSRRDGLVLLDRDGRVRRHLSPRQGLRWPWVCHAALDRQGGLWTSHEGGVSRIEADPALSLFDAETGVDSIQALTRYRGHLIAATINGLRRLEPAPSPFEPARWVSMGTDDGATWSLLDAGEVLLVGDREGIAAVRLSADGSLVRERIHRGRRAVRLARSPTDPDVVWGALEDGAVRLRRRDGAWRSDGTLRGLEIPVVYVEEDREGTLWIGTINGRYYRVRSTADWPEASFDTFDLQHGVPAGNAHLFRAGGELLFGTWDGFRRFDGERFVADRRFPEPLIDTTRDIHRMAEGPDGRLWIYAGGSVGPAIRRPDGSWSWDREPLAGLRDLSVSAIHVDSDGVVWLGRRDGVVRFDPAAWRPPVPLPAARVTRAAVPGRPEPLFGSAGLAAGFAVPPLEPGQRALRLEFAVADYSQPGPVEYRTRMDGVDDEWTAWTTESHRDFTSLPAGRRTFRVEARNPLGQVAPQGVLELRRLPPWYSTWPAYLAYVAVGLLLIAGSVVWLSRRRTARLEAERRRLEDEVRQRTAEIRRQARELEAEHEARSRFFANVSHELRTPLTLTLGPLEDAATGRLGPLPVAVAGSIGTALTNARQLRNLVDQVLDIGRLEAGRMPLAAAPADLDAFVRRVVARFTDAAARAEVELAILDGERAAAGGGESADERIRGGWNEVWFDPVHLDRVLGNLLANALKFTRGGGRVEVSVRRHRDGAEIAVRDTGVGIDPEALPRVFDRYFQAGRTVAREPGTGIGLALVRELVELHGGTVSAESVPGEGSTFRVRLPLGREHLADDQVAPEPEGGDVGDRLAPPPSLPTLETTSLSAEEVEPSAETPTLLIVEDNAELRGFLRQRFAGRYRVIEAADGEEALGLCGDRVPDLVVSDVMMPRMDGLELTRRLKADPELDFVPVLLLTARTATDDAVAGLGVGADDYLRKPFDGAELEARVERLIESRRRLRARFAAPEAASGVSGVDGEFDRRLLAALERLLEAGELTVQGLADELAMDRSHLYRRVQAVRGVSPQELVRKTRLQAAAAMLARGEGNVTEVAYGVGFKSLGHFSDSFRRHFGLSPSQWQRQSGSAAGRPAAAG